MPRQIYANLPVRNLERSKRFFTQLGFGFEPKFTDESAACEHAFEDPDGHIWELVYMEAGPQPAA